MFKFFKILIIVNFLFACATRLTQENYEKKLQTWVGHSEKELIETWGVPTNHYELENQKYLVYSNSKNIAIPGTAPTFYNMGGYATPIGGRAPMTINANCTTTFTLEKGVIKSWKFVGNACRA